MVERVRSVVVLCACAFVRLRVAVWAGNTVLDGERKVCDVVGLGSKNYPGVARVVLALFAT